VKKVSFAKSLLMLLSNDLRRIKNHFVQKKHSAVIAIFTVLLLAVFFIGIEYVVAQELFQHIMNQHHLEGLRYLLMAKLLQMVYLVFTLLLVYSNIVMSISAYFLSSELDLLHSRPISEKAIFFHSFFHTFIRSSWMFIAFGTPILYAYGTVMNQAAAFPAQIGLIILPSLILPTAIGILIGILLIYVFSPKRTQRVFLVMGIFLAVGLITVFRFMRPEQLVDPIGVEQVSFYLDTLRIPTISWLPTTWASEGIAAYGEGRLHTNQQYALTLWIATAAAILLTWLSFKLVWWRARSRGHSSDTFEATAWNTSRQKYRAGSRFRNSMFYRDVVLFRRDPGQWSQIIVISALVVIYVFNFKNLPYELYGFQYSMTFVSVAASGLILSALLARFGFPAVSTEGQSVWILKTSPINWRKYLWQKYFTLLVPTLLIGLILVLFSVRILDANPNLMFRALVTITLISASCTGLAVGLGARNPRYDLTDAAMVTVSLSGLWYMISAVVSILLIVAIMILPDVIRFMSWGWRFLVTIQHRDQCIRWILLGLITLFLTITPIESGIRHLKKTAR
jgi:ABC-2 type transport system permease protein